MLFYHQSFIILPDKVKLKTAFIIFNAFHDLLLVNVGSNSSAYKSAYI